MTITGLITNALTPLSLQYNEVRSVLRLMKQCALALFVHAWDMQMGRHEFVDCYARRLTGVAVCPPDLRGSRCLGGIPRNSL